MLFTVQNGIHQISFLFFLGKKPLSKNNYLIIIHQEVVSAYFHAKLK